MRRIIAFVALMLMSSASVFAQWAGEDKEVLKGESVTIGVPDMDPNVCYEWKDENATVIGTTPQVTVAPLHTSNYYVVRVSVNGVEEDMINVKVVDKIEIVSITPKKNCWTKGKSLSTSDFTIVTSPTGKENYVTINSSTNTAGEGCSLQSVATCAVIFDFDYHDMHDEETVSITVVDENQSVAVSLEGSVGEDLMKTIKGAVNDKAKYLTDIMKKSPIKLPCEPDEASFSGGYNDALSMECCDSVNYKRVVSVTGSFSAGLSCDWPLVGLWSVAELGATMSFSLGVSATGELTISACDQSSACLTVSISPSLSMGLYVQAWSDDVLRGEVTATANFDIAGIKVCYPLSCKFGALCIEIKGNAKLTLLSLVSMENSITLLDKRCLAGEF